MSCLNKEHVTETIHGPWKLWYLISGPLQKTFADPRLKHYRDHTHTRVKQSPNNLQKSLTVTRFIQEQFASSIFNSNPLYSILWPQRPKQEILFSETIRILFSVKEYNVQNRPKGQKRIYRFFVSFPSCSFQFHILKSCQVLLFIFSFLVCKDIIIMLNHIRLSTFN